MNLPQAQPQRMLALALAFVVSASATAPHLSAQANAFTPPTGPDGRWVPP